ncbi:MAG: zinc ribbon domain-containing protein [archaeon]|nr:zinc ribbon domain-containing protein [archaeon]
MARKRSANSFLFGMIFLLYTIGMIILPFILPRDLLYQPAFPFLLMFLPFIIFVCPILMIIFLLSWRSTKKNKVRPSTGVYFAPTSEINTEVITNTKSNIISEQKLTSKFCSYCGSGLSSEDKFCSQCNTKIEK